MFLVARDPVHLSLFLVAPQKPSSSLSLHLLLPSFVEDLVNQLGWDSLESRRLLAQVTLFYKIKNNLIDLEFPPSIQPAPRPRIQHAMLQPHSSVLAHSYSPFIRTVRVWNKLSTQTVQAENITSFKSLAIRDIQNMKTPNHLKRF